MAVLLVFACLVLSGFVQIGTAFKIGTLVKDPIATYNHDDHCFTQGLVIYNKILYESCGLYGKSSLRKISLDNYQVISSKKIPKDIFAEGIVVVNDLIFMLTWQNKILNIYDANTLDLIKAVAIKTHSTEGWGITTDGRSLIVSDGSDKLNFFKIPSSAEVHSDQFTELTKYKDTITVYDPVNHRGMKHVNELEYAQGYVFANIWYQDAIIQINPDTGHIVERYDLSKLYPKSRRTSRADCLNGIAYIEKDRTFLLTGKFWPKYYIVNFNKAFEEKEAEILKDSGL